MKTTKRYFKTKEDSWNFYNSLTKKYSIVEILDYYEHRKYARNNYCVQYKIIKR